jgi:hypothetical protein
VQKKLDKGFTDIHRFNHKESRLGIRKETGIWKGKTPSLIQ